MSEPHPNSSALFKQFCVAFGEYEDVAKEIEEFWAKPNSSPFPLEVYKHLVRKREADRLISHTRAEFLIHYFEESFEPEHTTGYADKHRAPLITAFAQAYSTTQTQHPVFRVEADIMNLGGLNKALETAFGKGHEREGRALADRVIGVMTNILKAHLAPLGAIAPIRSGGDELTVYVCPVPATEQAKLQDAVTAAETEMARFISEAGLREFSHLKMGKEAGVGIGCGISSLTDESGKIFSDVAITKKLDKSIKDGKEKFQTLLGDSKFTVQPKAGRHFIVREKIDSALRTFYPHSKPNYPYKRFLEEDVDFAGNTPEEARFRRARRNFPKSAGSDPGAEGRLLKATVDLTAKVDFVTGLPQFAAIERIVVPNFKAQPGHSDQARVVHIDCNNLGGGNRLGPWVGDAMARVFATSITEAMKTQQLEPYKRYLTSHGGGKFTLLLPASFDETPCAEFTGAIERQLYYRSQIPLKLNAEQQDATWQRLLELNTEAHKQRRIGSDDPRHRAHDHTPDEQSQSQFITDPRHITINDIDSVKSRRLGSHMVTLSPIVDLSKEGAVTQAVKRLEHMTRVGQDSIEPFDHRSAELEKVRGSEEGVYKRFESTAKANGESKPFTARVGKKLDKASIAGTIKVSYPLDDSHPLNR